MFAFPAAKRSLCLVASLLSSLLVVAAAGAAAVDNDQGYLGIKLQDLTPSMAKALQLDDRPGVMINEVVEGGPAQKAGLLDGDVILQLNGQAVSDYAALTASVRKMAPGAKARVVVLRDGKQKTVEVELGKLETTAEWPAAPEAYQLQELEDLQWLEEGNGKVVVLPHGEGHAPGVYSHGDGEGDGERRIIVRTMDDGRGWLGVKLNALNAQLGEYFGVKDGSGVLVTEVVEDSPAARAGLQAGDVIVKAGDADIASPDALHEAMADSGPGDDLALQVLRKGSPLTLTAKLGEMPEDAMKGRRVKVIGDGEHGDMKVFAPQMLRRMGRPGQDVEHEIIIERAPLAPKEMDAVRQEMEALRQELKQLREELKR